jgi:hypothetical protein
MQHLCNIKKNLQNLTVRCTKLALCATLKKYFRKKPFDVVGKNELGTLGVPKLFLMDGDFCQKN